MHKGQGNNKICFCTLQKCRPFIIIETSGGGRIADIHNQWQCILIAGFFYLFVQVINSGAVKISCNYPDVFAGQDFCEISIIGAYIQCFF